MPPHLLVLVGVEAGVADGAAEPGGGPRRPHLAGSVGVLAGQPKVEHEHLPRQLLRPAHGKVALKGKGRKKKKTETKSTR